MKTTNKQKNLFRNLDEVYLRLSLTDRCNLRCRYCMPADGIKLKPRSMMATDEELLRLVDLFNQVRPIYKLRLTGGEPLLRPTVTSIVRSLRKLLPDTRLCMTTNAIRMPKLANELRAAGLQSVNVSLDSSRADVFADLTRRELFKETMEGITAVRNAGFEEVKINAVLMRSINGDHLADLVKFAANAGCELRFIEMMPLGEGRQLYHDEYISADEAMERITEVFDFVKPLEEGATSRRYLLSAGGNEVKVGFITTMSAPFCDTCDRMRMDSYGRLYTCLRSVLPVNLLSPLRQNDESEVKRRILATMKSKVVPEGEWPTRPMATIGG